MKPAARTTDQFMCSAHSVPLTLPIVASSTVLINSLPGATQSPLTCGCAPVMASMSVLIEGKPAVRMGDPLPAGSILMGSANVLIGD